MIWHIEVREKPGVFDAVGRGIERDIEDLGIKSVERVNFVQVYLLDADIPEAEIRFISEELLIDKVTQNYQINPSRRDSRGLQTIEVAYNPGVMDPAEESVLKGLKDMGARRINAVRTAKKYIIKGRLNAAGLNTIASKLLYNKLIQHVVDPSRACSYPALSTDERSRIITVDLLGASDNKLKRISKDGQLFLNTLEMRRIRDYFRKLRRNPTDCELETIAQTWSEHCSHKTFRGMIKHRERSAKPRIGNRTIDNLLKSTIMKVTRELKKPWCVSVFQDNSGVIRFDRRHNVCFKVETHNHPSALEPFGGANTGIGGVIRDPLGTGLGARPILNTDVFCFGPPDYPFSRLPAGTLHPKRVMKGVVSGVRDYGNKMGIPTVNGAVLFHNGFVGNPLVYCGTAGIMPKEKSFKQVHRGDCIVVVGGRTGRDGIHGATFSSGELTHHSEKISGGAVQIGNPIQEKKMVDTILQARDKGLYHAITDCGAGGLSSAVGEMGQALGARVDLEKVPLKYAGLSYTEIWISESQERMVLAVAPDKADEIIRLFSAENVEATVIGEFTSDKRLKLLYKGRPVCDLEMAFLHRGIPKLHKQSVYIQRKQKEPVFKCPGRLDKYLLRLLSHYDICSKEWVVRQYDHEVQGGSVLKPLAGIHNDGPSDASIVKPVLDSAKGLIVSNGINFRFGFIDPYWMAASCIDEALRQVIAVGGSLKEVALLDNFCWGNPDKPDRLGGLVRAAYGCYDIARGFGVPFISGKDSLYNEYTIKHKSMAIPGTLLISAIAVMDDVKKALSMYLKEAGNLIYAVGDTYDELGASHYYDLLGCIGNHQPLVYPKVAREIFAALSRASASGLIRSMHDCSDGGIAVCAAEMAFSGGLGVELFLKEVPCRKMQGKSYRNDRVLFSESNSRFLVEVEPKRQAAFEKVMRGLPFGLAGCVSRKKKLVVYGLNDEVCLEAGLEELKEAWQSPLRY